MTHPLLNGDEDPPGEWQDGWIGGGGISFKRPAGDGEYHYVVIGIGGDTDDPYAERPIEVWTATVPDGHILWNYKGTGETIGECVGTGNGAEMALEYMEEDSEPTTWACPRCDYESAHHGECPDCGVMLRKEGGEFDA